MRERWGRGPRQKELDKKMEFIMETIRLGTNSIKLHFLIRL